MDGSFVIITDNAKDANDSYCNLTNSISSIESENVIASNTSLSTPANPNDSASVSVDWNLGDDSINDESLEQVSSINNNQVNQVKSQLKKIQKREDSHDIIDSYDFNVNNMLPILNEKKSTVISIAKENNVILPDRSKVDIANNTGDIDTSVKIKSTLQVLNRKTSSIVDMAKISNRDVKTMQEKLKASGNDDNAKGDVKSVNDAYENDKNDMDNVLHILNQKQNSVLNMAKIDNDNALSVADSVKTIQKSKHLAAVTAANDEDLNLIKASKNEKFFDFDAFNEGQNNNIKINQDSSAKIQINDDNDAFKFINESKSNAYNELFEQNQTETLEFLKTIKNNRKTFLESILD